MCMCKCKCQCKCICKWTCICVIYYIYVNVYVTVNVCDDIYIFVFVFANVYVYVYVYVCMHACPYGISSTFEKSGRSVWSKNKWKAKTCRKMIHYHNQCVPITTVAPDGDPGEQVGKVVIILCLIKGCVFMFRPTKLHFFMQKSSLPRKLKEVKHITNSQERLSEGFF